MKVTNYSYIDEAEIMDVNGSKFAVAEDDMGFLTILRGDVWKDSDDNEVFHTFDSEKQSFTQIPTNELLDAISNCQ